MCCFIWVWNLVPLSLKEHRFRWLRTRCWGKYLDLRGRKWRETGKDFVKNSFMICTLHQILLGWSRKMGWVGDVAHKGEMRNAYKISVLKCEGKRPLHRPTRRLEENRIIRKLFGRVWIWCIWLRIGNSGRRALLNAGMNQRFSKKVGNFFTIWVTVSFWRRTLFPWFS